MADLSLSEARRIALAAQGFSTPRNGASGGQPPGLDDLRRVISHLNLLQIDTVNVLARAHYMPVYSRLGPYESWLIDDLAYFHRELFEYWAHAASFIPMRLYPVLKHRMVTRREKWLEKVRTEYPGFVERVLDQVRERGPISVSDLEDSGGRTGPWWGLSRGKMALEWHFDRGAVGVHSRRNFTRYYDLPERFVPQEQLDAAVPTEEEANREMLLLSARSHGVGTETDLADYFRIKTGPARKLLKAMVADGELEMVRVEGWDAPAFVLPGTNVPLQRVEARSVVSPFDSLIWERDRTERLFGMRYRIEIYVPAPKRQFGYYVFPFLMDEELVARVDLKADRQGKRLLVQAAHLEARNPQRDAVAVAAALADELASLARWLGLERVVIGRKGDLADGLRRAVKTVRV